MFKLHYHNFRIAVPLQKGLSREEFREKIGGVVGQFNREVLVGRGLEQVDTWRTTSGQLAQDLALQLSPDIEPFRGLVVDIEPVVPTEQRGRIGLPDFEIMRCVGSGGFSKVYLARKKASGLFYALKLMDKENIRAKEKEVIVENERSVMMRLEHPFIVKLLYAFESRHFVVFATEFCPGGELFYNLRLIRRLREEQARVYFVEILLGIQHMHEKKVVYRDLKPENIFLDAEGHVKIGDFGLCRLDLGRQERARTFCGSIEYMPPEMINKEGHSYTMDYYCLGALLYEMVVGIPPFYSKNQAEMKHAILNEELSIPDNLGLSSEVRDLMERLLKKEPNYRLGAMAGTKEILAHPWVRVLKAADVLAKKHPPPLKPTLTGLNIEVSDIGDDEPEFTAKLLRHQHDPLRPKDELFNLYFSSDREAELSSASQQDLLLTSKLASEDEFARSRSPFQQESRKARQDRIHLNQHRSPPRPKPRKSRDKHNKTGRTTLQRMKSAADLR